ncbi:MAG: amidase family protein, partial [Solirubrobacteraceae bacterium]
GAAPQARPPRVGLLPRLLESVATEPGVRAGFEQILASLRERGFPLCELDAELSSSGFGKVLAAEFSAAWAPLLELTRARPSSGIRDALARGAQIPVDDCLRARERLASAERSARRLFERVDVLATPTCAIAPPPLAAPASVAEASALTRPFSALGWPCISIPCGRVDGAPAGLQLIGAPHADGAVLAAAARVAAAIAPVTGSPARAGEGEDG